MEDATKLNFIKHFTGLRLEDMFDGSNQSDIRSWIEDQRQIYNTRRGVEHDEAAWRIASSLVLSGAALRWYRHTPEVDSWLSTVNGIKRVDQVMECEAEVDGNSFDQKFLISTKSFGILLGQDFVKSMGGSISAFEVIRTLKDNFINQVYLANKGSLLILVYIL